MKRGARWREYNKGLWKYLALFVLALIALEGLALYFPLLLQRQVTEYASGSSASVTSLALRGLLVLSFIILIFGVQSLMEWMGSMYADKYQANIRKSLYDKFSKLSAEQIDQIGVARIIPIIINDSSWLKTYNRRLVQLCVYFPVAILGSFIMLFTLNWIYALIAFVSVPIVLVFFWLNIRRMSKLIPPSIDAYDEYFLNIKEGIKGAKDIRILGKADERSAEFERFVKLQRRQGIATDRAHALSTGFNAILFTVITIAIVIFAAAANLTPGEMGGIVVLNTAIQYINRIWGGSHTIFTWLVDFVPRCRYTVKRLDGYYNMPEQPASEGLDKIPTYTKNSLKLKGIVLTQPNGKTEIENMTVDVPDGKLVSIAGGIGSGKTYIWKLLLNYTALTEGTITFNDIDISQINSAFWRRSVVSFASNSPQFISGTIRDNMKLFAPEVTDEEILKVFKEIGAEDFVKKFDSILDYEIKADVEISDNTKNLLNLVRAVLKPANIYFFNQCFEHVKESYIVKLMAKLKRERKTCLFVSYNAAVCKYCDNIYVMRNGRVKGMGKHAELFKTNTDYRVLSSSGAGVMVDEEQEPKIITDVSEVPGIAEVNP